MGKSLYRTYRSKSFDEIIGQDHIVTTLINSIKNESIAHAYLLSGPRGVGKTSVARILAYAVNEIEYGGEATNLDIIEIDAASNRRIDEIREIRDKVAIAPVAGKYKVYIIDEVHMLTREAFNALLKTLEEPPAHVIFILATTESHKVPETILSRCIKLTFKPIEINVLKNHLKQIAKSEKIKITDDALELIAKHGRGSFRDAISILDQVKNSSSEIDSDQINLMLGLASDLIINNLMSYIENGQLQNINTELINAKINGVNISNLTSQISERLRQSLINNSSPILDNQDILKTLSELLEVQSSLMPEIALEICLQKLAINQQTKTKSKLDEPAHHESEVSKKTEKMPDTPQMPKHEESTIALEKPLEPKVEAEIIVKPEIIIEKIEDQNNLWPEILKVLKTKNSTLYGIARMAEVNQTEDTLELTFKFKFHHKQMTEPKNQQIFSEIIKQLSNSPIELKLHAPQEKVKPNLIKTNQDLSTISNIFGSTEVLES